MSTPSPFVAHVGIAVDHPLNVEIIAYLTRQVSREERRAGIEALEQALAKSPSAILAKSLARLRDESPDPPRPPSQDPNGVNMMTLGALPEIVRRLWDIGRGLPTDCRWVAHRRAVLAHSQTGILFGLAVVTLGIALRLPQAALQAAEAAGATQGLTYKAGFGKKTISALEPGMDWRFCDHAGDAPALARASYEHFGEA
jgi:hypothetical protein